MKRKGMCPISCTHSSNTGGISQFGSLSCTTECDPQPSPRGRLTHSPPCLPPINLTSRRVLITENVLFQPSEKFAIMPIFTYQWGRDGYPQYGWRQWVRSAVASPSDRTLNAVSHYDTHTQLMAATAAAKCMKRRKPLGPTIGVEPMTYRLGNDGS